MHVLFKEKYTDRAIARIIGCSPSTVGNERATVSDGMKKEISRARWRNIPVRHFTEDCKEVVHHV